jgi:ABC-2 type transport system permease protein
MSATFALLRRRAAGWWALAALQPKFFLAFRGWVWMDMVSRLLTLIIVTSFWRAVYENTTTISTLNLQQTLNYVMLADFFGRIAFNSPLWWVGWWIRDGQIAIEMLRPMDLQLQMLINVVANNVLALVISIPMILIAMAFFSLQLPGDPLVWLAFLISLLLGQIALFFWDWIYMCLAFYTTEVWGLGVLREGMVLFLSGALIPLQMMPGWLLPLVNATPLAQALAVPVSLLSGATPLTQAPQVWATQIAWLVVGYVLSRWVFSIAVRKITVQGG